MLRVLTPCLRMKVDRRLPAMRYLFQPAPSCPGRAARGLPVLDVVKESIKANRAARLPMLSRVLL